MSREGECIGVEPVARGVGGARGGAAQALVPRAEECAACPLSAAGAGGAGWRAGGSRARHVPREGGEGRRPGGEGGAASRRRREEGCGAVAVTWEKKSSRRVIRGSVAVRHEVRSGKVNFSTHTRGGGARGGESESGTKRFIRGDRGRPLRTRSGGDFREGDIREDTVEIADTGR